MEFDQETGIISQEETTTKTVNIAVYVTQAFKLKDDAILLMHNGNMMLDKLFEELEKDPTLSKYLPTELIDKLIAYDSKFDIYKRV